VPVPARALFASQLDICPEGRWIQIDGVEGLGADACVVAPGADNEPPFPLAVKRFEGALAGSTSQTCVTRFCGSTNSLPPHPCTAANEKHSPEDESQDKAN
jgi:hypothetical protein